MSNLSMEFPTADAPPGFRVQPGPSPMPPTPMPFSIVDTGVVRALDRERLRTEFQNAEPFPHLVLRNLFTAECLDSILGDFSQVSRSDWLRFDTANEVKRASRPGARLGSASQLYIDTVHRGDFIALLSEITGIAGLIPDPTLFGGGLHEIPDGGRFSLHTDFNRHPATDLDTRLVLITYLNHDWQSSYGGTLELWDRRADVRVKEVVPHFGTSILFAHSADSLHGHPNPVQAPDGRNRRSIAVYYYSNGRPDAGEATTTRFHRPIVLGPWARTVNTAKYFVPPVLVDGIKAVRRLRR